MGYLLILLIFITGCASVEPVTVRYDIDRFGVPVPVVDGKPYPLTDDERRRIGQAFVDEYCKP